jgi:PEP-CTERM motif
MRLVSLFLALVSLLSVATAQILNEGENYPLEKGQASDPLYGKRPARTMSQREYSQLYERQVVHPALESGFLTGALALNLQTGEVSICEKAPEPSSLSLLAVSGLAFFLRKRQRS